MILTDIVLTRFRGFDQQVFSFDPHLTVILGENARGKTSLLEGIYTAIFGSGFRETRELELIQWDKPDAYIQSKFLAGEQDMVFQIYLKRNEINRVAKTFSVSKTTKPYAQYRKMQTAAVLFAPQQISIISGSPTRRRDYLDSVLSAVDLNYRRRSRNYENALRKRNKLLETYLDEMQLEDELSFWDNYLVEQAEYVTRRRRDFVDYLNAHPEMQTKRFTLKYEANEFSHEKLKRVHSQERMLRRTIIGPQKDDFTIFLDTGANKDIHLYGSRSEQRLGVFWLKLNEIQFMQDSLEHKPLLLLDDIFSELDRHNKEIVMQMIDGYQTIVTTTEEEVQELAVIPGEVIRL
ncbi:MAG: DNA replication/repair protein RecF [Weeksellaceae bacterium]